MKKKKKNVGLNLNDCPISYVAYNSKGSNFLYIFTLLNIILSLGPDLLSYQRILNDPS